MAELVKPRRGLADTADMTVIPSQLGLLSKLMDAAQLRQQVIAQNVANVNTPGYHRLDVAFEDILAERLEGQNPADLGDLAPVVRAMEGLPERADGNNVDMDMEMGQLSKNALLYQTYAQILASQLATMRSAITGQ